MSQSVSWSNINQGAVCSDAVYCCIFRATKFTSVNNSHWTILSFSHSTPILTPVPVSKILSWDVKYITWLIRSLLFITNGATKSPLMDEHEDCLDTNGVVRKNYGIYTNL